MQNPPERLLSLAALTVLELSPLEQVQCAARAGFSHVGLRLLPATPEERSWPAVGDTPLVRATRQALADGGVQVLDIEILRLKPETDVRDFLPVLDTAAALGARYLLVAGNDDDESRLADNLAALCVLAAPLGLQPCLEPMPWTDVRNVVQAARIVAASGRADAGVLVDAIHFDRAGSALAELAAIAPSRLHYLQLCDAPAARPTDLAELLRQARCDRLLPGEGALDLAGLLHALPATAPISLEIPLARPLDPLPRARLVRETTQRWLAGLAR
jgi:sugar phosphate isomerase/epimerase